MFVHKCSPRMIRSVFDGAVTVWYGRETGMGEFSGSLRSLTPTDKGRILYYTHTFSLYNKVCSEEN